MSHQRAGRRTQDAAIQPQLTSCTQIFARKDEISGHDYITITERHRKQSQVYLVKLSYLFYCPAFI